jgi:hypothetical protein
MDREVKRRQEIEQQNELKISDQNCTFQPKINKKTEAMRARTIFEMSTADHERKKNNRMALELEARQRDMADLTFQPKISHYAKDAGKSVLQVSLSDADQFQSWLKESTQRKEEKRRQIMRERDEKEQVECTFSPKTTDCPAYVRRIAKSMSIVKAARNSTSSLLDPESSKPQWR